MSDSLHTPCKSRKLLIVSANAVSKGSLKSRNCHQLYSILFNGCLFLSSMDVQTREIWPSIKTLQTYGSEPDPKCQPSLKAQKGHHDQSQRVKIKKLYNNNNPEHSYSVLPVPNPGLFMFRQRMCAWQRERSLSLGHLRSPENMSVVLNWVNINKSKYRKPMEPRAEHQLLIWQKNRGQSKIKSSSFIWRLSLRVKPPCKKRISKDNDYIMREIKIYALIVDFRTIISRNPQNRRWKIIPQFSTLALHARTVLALTQNLYTAVRGYKVEQIDQMETLKSPPTPDQLLGGLSWGRGMTLKTVGKMKLSLVALFPRILIQARIHDASISYWYYHNVKHYNYIYRRLLAVKRVI